MLHWQGMDLAFSERDGARFHWSSLSNIVRDFCRDIYGNSIYKLMNKYICVIV